MIDTILKKQLACGAITLVMSVAFFAGCDRSGPEEEHAHNAGHIEDDGHMHSGQTDHPEVGEDHSTSSHTDPAGERDHASSGLQLTPEQLQRIDLRLATASPGSLHRRISFPGEITLDQDSFIQLVPRISGIITEVKVTTGDKVSAGQVLAVLESPEIGKVKAEFLEASRESRFQEAELERFRNIRKNTNNLIIILDSEPEITELDQGLLGDMAGYGNRLISSYAEYSVARKAFERKQALFEKRISSEKDFLAARGAYEGRRAEYLSLLSDIRYSLEQEWLNSSKARQAGELRQESAASRLSTIGMTEEEISRLAATIDQPDPATNRSNLTSVNLRAPRSGTILERSAGVGARAESDTILFTLAELDHVWANLKAPARDLAHVKTGQLAEISAESGTTATGRIAVVGPLVSEDTRTADVRVVLDNHSGDWTPGLFVRGFINLPGTESTLVVPKKALQNINGEDFVFVPSGEDTFITAPVVKGREDSTSVEIVSGLQPGAKYVAEGSFELKAIIITGAMDPHAGHGH